MKKTKGIKFTDSPNAFFFFFTGPRTIRGKGRKFGSDTPVRTHGIVFRELWVSSLHPRLGCFSGSDLRG